MLGAMVPTGSPDEKPAFLSKETAEQIGYVGAPPDAVPTFDHELEPLPPLEGDLPARGKGPSLGYEERHRAIARLHAFGYTNNQIARHLGYSAPGVSLALRQPWTQAEVARVRTAMLDQDVLTKLKAAGHDAMDHLHRTILDPSVKEDIRSTNARWAVEKLTGKARQEVTVESGTLGTFMELLKNMQSRGEPLDVTPQLPAAAGPVDAEPVAEWSEWLDSNLAR